MRPSISSSRARSRSRSSSPRFCAARAAMGGSSITRIWSRSRVSFSGSSIMAKPRGSSATPFFSEIKVPAPWRTVTTFREAKLRRASRTVFRPTPRRRTSSVSVGSLSPGPYPSRWIISKSRWVVCSTRVCFSIERLPLPAVRRPLSFLHFTTGRGPLSTPLFSAPTGSYPLLENILPCTCRKNPYTVRVYPYSYTMLRSFSCDFPNVFSI